MQILIRHQICSHSFCEVSHVSSSRTKGCLDSREVVVLLFAISSLLDSSAQQCDGKWPPQPLAGLTEPGEPFQQPSALPMLTPGDRHGKGYASGAPIQKLSCQALARRRKSLCPH